MLGAALWTLIYYIFCRILSRDIIFLNNGHWTADFFSLNQCAYCFLMINHLFHSLFYPLFLSLSFLPVFHILLLVTALLLDVILPILRF